MIRDQYGGEHSQSRPELDGYRFLKREGARLRIPRLACGRTYKGHGLEQARRFGNGGTQGIRLIPLYLTLEDMFGYVHINNILNAISTHSSSGLRGFMVRSMQLFRNVRSSSSDVLTLSVPILHLGLAARCRRVT